MNKNIERLNNLANTGLYWYGADPRRDFSYKRLFNHNYTEKQRMLIIRTLIEVYETVPIKKNSDGLYTFDKLTDVQSNIVSYAYYDLSAKVLRGTEKDYKIQDKYYEQINRWNPLLMYVLSTKHGIPYEDFYPHPFLLGRDLRDLVTKIDDSETPRINIHGKYYVGPLNKLLREESTDPEVNHREQITDDDEDRINYKADGNQLIPNFSAWAYAFRGEYPNTYDKINDRYKMSTDLMESLVQEHIVNKVKIQIPEGYEF